MHLLTDIRIVNVNMSSFSFVIDKSVQIKRKGKKIISEDA